MQNDKRSSVQGPTNVWQEMIKESLENEKYRKDKWLG